MKARDLRFLQLAAVAITVLGIVFAAAGVVSWTNLLVQTIILAAAVTLATRRAHRPN